ncbi:hypothetical protein QS795_006875 [Providencia zhijiangensis]|uniref:Zinc resistance-associated protein n=1 Tax=Providencia zhijiangensis TaxID=3053982 RepID=A0ABZ0N6M5_9GAMM|nr:hypothetical protein [Providencia sp. D4759]WPA93481.1 hypothetical protein QS795_006875 [Providencia sp. D4759]
MNKKVLLGAIVSSVLLYSASAAACPYCNGNYDHRYQNNYHQNNYRQNDYRQSNEIAKLAKEFDDKRFELNKLYDAGAKDDDAKVKALVKELDDLSLQLRNEEDKQYNRPYRDGGWGGRGNHRGCW